MKVPQDTVSVSKATLPAILPSVPDSDGGIRRPRDGFAAISGNHHRIDGSSVSSHGVKTFPTRNQPEPGMGEGEGNIEEESLNTG